MLLLRYKCSCNIRNKHCFCSTVHMLAQATRAAHLQHVRQTLYIVHTHTHTHTHTPSRNSDALHACKRQSTPFTLFNLTHADATQMRCTPTILRQTLYLFIRAHTHAHTHTHTYTHTHADATQMPGPHQTLDTGGMPRPCLCCPTPRCAR
jgi:hypothetical protein